MDPRLRRALTAQLAARRALLAGGARHVGWKLGVGDRERIGDGPVVGCLTSATELPSGAAYRGGGEALHADAEVALVLAADVPADATAAAARSAIGGLGAALEIVDLAGPDDAEAVVAANVFHRAVAFGPLGRLDRPTTGSLVVGGETRAAAPVAADLGELVRAVAALLGAVGERLRAGDRLITGSVVQVPIAPGDEVVADLDALGRVALAIGGGPGSRRTAAG